MSGESDVEQEESDDDGMKENDDYGSSQDEDSDDEDEDSDDEEAKLQAIIAAQEAKIGRQEAMILDCQKRIAANSAKSKDTDTESQLAWYHKLKREYQICERGRRLGGRIFFVLGPFSCLCYLPPLTELCEGSNNNKNPLFQCPTLQLVE